MVDIWDGDRGRNSRISSAGIRSVPEEGEGEREGEGKCQIMDNG